MESKEEVGMKGRGSLGVMITAEWLRSNKHGGATERALVLVFALELRWSRWEKSDELE